MKKEIQEYITELLALINEAFPSEHLLHKFTLTEGNVLTLWVLATGRWYGVAFGEVEDVSAAELAASIIQSVRTQVAELEARP